MNQIERNMLWALQRCTFLPGSFDKNWVKKCDPNRPLTEKGRNFMEKVFDKYRRQIPGHASLKAKYQASRNETK